MEKRMKRYGKKNSRKKVRPEALVLSFLILSMVFYGLSKLGINSYNITLQMQDQKLAEQVQEKEQEVEDLKNEVNSLQDKSRVLGMLDNQVSDNQNNIYIMN